MFFARLVTASIIGFALLASPGRSHAVGHQKPCDITGCAEGGWAGVPGPGPGDKVGGEIPPGGDKRPEGPVPEAEAARAKVAGIIYALANNRDLLWYGHNGRAAGTFEWVDTNARKVGNGWNMEHVFSGDGGVIYAITPVVKATLATGIGPGMGARPQSGGDLLWYRHEGRLDGTFRWPSNGRKVGVGWNMKHVFSGGAGVIYAVNQDNDLMWYRHDGRDDGTFRWAFPKGRTVGSGWNMKHVFAAPGGVIYAVDQNNDLLWYRHDGREDGTFRWSFDRGKKIAGQWDMKHVFQGGGGVIYAINQNDDLLWFRHDGQTDGTARWAFPEGKKIGNGWNFPLVFSGAPLAR